jgi:hypothetical protein
MTEYRTVDEIAALIAVAPDTLRSYRTLSKPGGRYEAHPFPRPDRMFGRTPVWTEDQYAEIRAWAAARPGQGAGGGRPARAPQPESGADMG